MKPIIYAILFISALILAAYVFPVLLLAFAGLLVAILLRSAADWLHAHSKLSHGLSMAIVVLGVAAIIVGNVWLFGVTFAHQLDQLKVTLTNAWDQARTGVGKYEWARGLFQERNTEAIFSRAPGAVGGVIRFFGGLVLIVMIGLYTASNPDLYRLAFVRMFPLRTRPRVNETLLELANALRWWLAGQMVSMIVVGTLTTIGLRILGVPLPFTLGFLGAVLTFVPNVGAIISATLGTLMALTVSVHLAGSVLILYAIILSFEGYLLTPLIQQRAVELPPGLTITMQALMGVLVGGLGLALAAPLTVVGLVLIRKFHLKQNLRRRNAA